MMKSDAVGKSFAVLLMGETVEGEDDWAVFSGTLEQNASGFFLNRGAEPPFQIQPEWVERIKPVETDVREIMLDAEHYLSLSVGPIPKEESTESYISTGLKWPE